MIITSKYLNQDTIAALQSFQIEKIDREITDYLDTNNKMNTYHFEYCPKCGCNHPRLIKNGFANSGKQMLRCKECGNVLLWTAVSLLFILTKTNQNRMNLSWIH
jgi:hypothetical protein